MQIWFYLVVNILLLVQKSSHFIRIPMETGLDKWRLKNENAQFCCVFSTTDDPSFEAEGQV